MRIAIFGAFAMAAMLASGCSHSDQSILRAPSGAGALVRPSGSSPAIYVTEETQGTLLLTFLQSDNGDVAPQRVVDGSGAGVPAFGGVTVAPGGDLYVTDLNNSRLIAYPASASGPAPPLLTISCGGMDGPNSLVFDHQGHLYAANGGGPPFSISIFPASASGCVSGNPLIVGTRTRLYNPQGIASTGPGRLYVINNNDSITEYKPGAIGDAGWIRRIHGPLTGLATNSQCGNAIAIDGSDNIYAANASGNSITVYAPNADGDAPPIRKIAGAKTGLNTPRAVVVDASGDIFVANSAGASILVFGPGSNGNVAPIRTISGAQTRLSNFVVGIALSR